VTNLPNYEPSLIRTVLVSYGQATPDPLWLHGLDDAFRPCRLSACRTHTRDSTLEMVERGGLSAAVLVDDRPRIDGLSVVRAIRSIDTALPCWLVIAHATRRILEVALELSVCGVMEPMADVTDLSSRLAKYLDDPLRRN
jgi:hypothetical protein